jgi:hypothetical protein
MEAAGARDYMREKIVHYLNVTPPHDYLNHGVKGWGPTARITYLNGHQCDLYLSLHENGSGGIGGTTIVSRLPGADAPPADQIKLGKFMLKYLDPFDMGLRQTGLTVEDATNLVGMLHHTNQRRASYIYMEMEFMDAVDPNNAAQYTYNLMVQPAFIDTLADQIASAIIEILLNRQAGLDAVKMHSLAALQSIW